MRIEQVKSPSFGILNRGSIKKQFYGEYFEGNYKGNRIEVYDAYRDNKLLVLLYNRFGQYVKCKLRFTKARPVH